MFDIVSCRSWTKLKMLRCVILFLSNDTERCMVESFTDINKPLIASALVFDIYVWKNTYFAMLYVCVFVTLVPPMTALVSRHKETLIILMFYSFSVQY